MNTDLAAAVDTVTVFTKEKSSKDTSRYARIWRTVSTTLPTLIVTVTGNSATFTGIGGSGQIAGLDVNGVAYTVAVSDTDTPMTVAANLAALIPGATASGNVVVVPGAQLSGQVVGSGTAVMETRRQEQGFLVSVWSSTPAARDALAAAVDSALADIDWFDLADGSVARMVYAGTAETDISENANLYRRNLVYTIEYPTLKTMTGPQMVYGIGTLGGSGPTVGFSCLVPQTKLVVPPLGAIRFDAWYDPGNSIDQQCAAALSPAQFNSRLPPNAVIQGGVATWPVATQATIDVEIAAALQAGLQFWAFDSYQPGDTLSLPLQLYLTSSLRGRLKFCMLGQTSNWGASGQDQPSLLRDIRMMTQPGYMTVLGNRPLYFVLDSSSQQTAGLPDGSVSEAIAMVRSSVMRAGAGNPYVVWLSGAALADYNNISAAQMAGADATGAYATPRLNGNEQPFAALAGAAVADWSARASSGFPMVPTAMTGWDQRPLIETPQPFYPISSDLSAGNYYDTATASAIGEHVAAMAQFVHDQSSACPAQVGLIYAWNELAEGGWLMPTYTPDGPDGGRCAAVGGALTALVANSTKPAFNLVS
ncbi:hypothetical protein NFI95_04925 [Acetobacteraceae bacterium KSS8]|uniref:Uncharacterized protein n=1 Tax=Endosaccharibacter trunci TaxID=2812733 RepID=A0ABT1W6J8_9PROT|nr:hypothetical protein [Acetobacteraceae bacterium KSS8]